MPPQRLDVALDGASARLLALVQAAQLDGTLPRESGRQLVNMAKAVRAYGIAREYDLAKDCLGALVSAVPDEGDTAPLAKAIRRHGERVKATLR